MIKRFRQLNINEHFTFQDKPVNVPQNSIFVKRSYSTFSFRGLFYPVYIIENFDEKVITDEIENGIYSRIYQSN